jgi:hypothetical protein
MLEIVADISSLSRSATGMVLGSLFLRDRDEHFPEAGWSDFPVVLLDQWIRGLTDVVRGRATTFRGCFMEGPFAFSVARGPDLDGAIAWGRYGEETERGPVEIAQMLRLAVAAGRQVAESCRSRGWESRDLASLEAAIKRSAV